MGIRNDIKHYWQVDEPALDDLDLAVKVLEKPVLEEDIEWLEDRTYRFVADFPVGFYERAISCRPNEMPIVAVWVLDD